MRSVPTPGPAPLGFAPPEMWPEFGAIASPAPLCRREHVGDGIRWSLWPLCFEMYTGDTDPDLVASNTGSLAYNRLVLWKRVRRTDIPHGWHLPLQKKSWRVDGFVHLQENYRDHWSKDAQRNIKNWEHNHLGKTYRIVNISFAQFKDHYLTSLTKKKAGTILFYALERQYALPDVKNNIVFWGVQNIQTGTIVAGTAVIFSPTYKSSLRECPFIFDEAKKIDAMTGLIDHWFKESLHRGMTTLVFTYFWDKGSPKDWRGFSNFKSHFIQGYVVYPPMLWRFVRGKFF